MSGPKEPNVRQFPCEKVEGEIIHWLSIPEIPYLELRKGNEHK